MTDMEQTAAVKKRFPFSRRDFVNYAVLPGFKPRVMNLVSSGFQYVAYFIALVYGAVRLLPAGHVYTNPNNIGQFGIRHVIAQAADHLVFDWKNIDQILVFMFILIGMVIGLIQIMTFGMSLFMLPVMASEIGFKGFFVTENPEQDIAHILLDLVFGVPDMFNSCIATGVECLRLENGQGLLDRSGDEIPAFAGGFANSAQIPFPIHHGLHQMFQIYSLGLLVIAVIITTYFVITIVAETAQTGTAFGKRFNKVWAPIRLVVAFGLLIPIGAQGLNSSQYIVLNAAKFGSAFATNGWIKFNDVLTGSYLGEVDKLIAEPNIPEIGSVLQFVYTARVCAEYNRIVNGADGDGDGRVEATIHPYLVKNPISAPNHLKLAYGTPYDSALTFADNDMAFTMRFGIRSETDFGIYKGFVKPICGELSFNITDGRTFSLNTGNKILEQAYWDSIMAIWNDTDARKYALATVKCGINNVGSLCDAKPDKNFAVKLHQDHEKRIKTALDEALAEERKDEKWKNPDGLLDRGWGGAALWYNRVADLNGAVTTAIFNVPIPTKYPDVMEQVRRLKKEVDQNVAIADRYDPVFSSGQEAQLEKIDDKTQANVLNEAFSFWQNSGVTISSHIAPTGNPILDFINAIFGTQGIFDMRANADIHPLAQLSAVGRGLIESAVRNLGLAAIGGVTGSLASSFLAGAGGAVSVVSGFLITIGIITMTLGWVLFYVVPFLPFIYFLFATVGWVKGIFEAMVGAPLWALAHIRIDGDGLSGKAAEAGYYLIFEIFIRPILILFGLLASIVVFAAMVQLLNETFDLVVSNLTGFNAEATEGATIVDVEFYRAPVDEFMYTVIYTVIVYLLAMSSFKLVDTIPNQILRWMGQSLTTFNDSREDPAAGLMSKAFIGGQQTISALGGGLRSVSGIADGGAPR
jgi:conjugal transfer/type IV secretion protein DotA/TraY